MPIITVRVLAWLLVFTLVLLWSAWQPHDRLTWWLEVLPAIIALIVLSVTRKRFPLTSLAYVLILVHAVILMVGGHYTYAEVPVGDWLQSITGGSRNNYDKLGHLAQGFVPALIAREILIRHQATRTGAWTVFTVISFCLALSAFYELLEWWAALLSTEAAESFLGTQGYEWDTQSDMLWALSGAIACLLLLSRWHDRQLKQLANSTANSKENSGSNAA